jgi:Tfp pilus assembly protein PilF
LKSQSSHAATTCADQKTLNLALAPLIAADLDAAEQAVNQALAADPNDSITRNVALMIKAVKSGKKPQPRRISDLQ